MSGRAPAVNERRPNDDGHRCPGCDSDLAPRVGECGACRREAAEAADSVRVPLFMFPGMLRHVVVAIDGARAADLITDAHAAALRQDARAATVRLPVYTLEEVARGAAV